MVTDESSAAAADPVERACQVDSIRDAFEAAWREGRIPRIEDYLVGADVGARRELLDALFAVEFSCRVRRGDAPRVEDYQDRFPADLGRFAQIAADVARDRTVAHYQVLQRLGLGSFASVYLALDTRLHRTVALKLSHGRWNDQAEAIFTREAKAAAQLDHPHIVPVFDFGRHDDTMFIAAQHVPGPSLKEWQHGRTVGWAEAARLCARLAAAVHHAHQRGVIHRDLKPANIIIDQQGEPHITDFGLAKWADDATLTGAGDLKGTPAYMSPEQARGDARQVTIQSDVYALGVILYELLTGQRPFDGAADEVIRQVLHDSPRPPRQLRTAIPRDLETICLKALTKESRQRYATAHDLANDLDRVLRGQPIEARPAGFVERLSLWCRREPRLAAATAAVIVLFFTLGCGAGYWAWSIDKARREATKNLQSTALFAQLLAQLIDAKDPMGLRTTAHTGPQLAGFAFGLEGDAAAKRGEALDDLARALIGQLPDRPQARARLLEALANGYRGLGRTADARPLYEEAIELRKLISDERTRQLAVGDAQFYLAWNQLEGGDCRRARASFEEVARARSHWLGTQHPDAVAAEAGIVAAMMAEEHQEPADKEHAGGENDVLFEAWQLLAALRVSGSDSRVVAALHAYPDIRRHGGPGWLGVYDELLANARLILGEEHPVLAILLLDAAGMHRAAGDDQRAEQWTARALPMARKFFGAHPRLMGPLREFAAASAEQGGFSLALEAYRDALRIADRRQPDNRPLRAELLFRSGEVRLASGACGEAAADLAQALEVLGPSELPDEDALRRPLLMHLVEAHVQLGQHEAARRYAQKLLQRPGVFDGAVKSGAPIVAGARTLALADLLRTLGSGRDADRLEEGALRVALEQHGRRASLDPPTCAAAADVLARHQRWLAAVAMCDQALAGERSGLAAPRRVARRCHELAAALMSAARHIDDPRRREELLHRAQPLLAEALDIRQRADGMESHFVAELLLDRARLQMALGQRADARAEAIRALQHRRRLHDGPHILTARTLLAVSELLAEAGDPVQAEQLKESGQEMLKGLLPATHRDLQ